MITKVLIQKLPETGEFGDANTYSAWYGFQKLGMWTESYFWKDLNAGNVELSRETLVVGGILPVRTALERLGCPPPLNVDYPDALLPFLRRKVWKSTLRAVRASCMDDHLPTPVFIKPITGHKDFTGHTVFKFRDLIKTAGHPLDMPVWASEVVNFQSEFRGFVRRGKLVGLRHYTGDPLCFPDPAVVRDAVATYEASGEAPVAYTIDMGVLDTGETALIEINDGFAFGTYGLAWDTHARMLRDRWCQMVGLPLDVG